MIVYKFTYLFSAEYISAAKSKGEILLFRRGHAPAALQMQPSDIEKAPKPEEKMEQTLNPRVADTIHRQTAIFQWKDVCYDIKIKKESRRTLDHVDGWVKPGN